MSAASLGCSIFWEPNYGSPGDTGTRKGLTWCFTNLSWIPSAHHSLCSIKAGSTEQGGRRGLRFYVGWEELSVVSLAIWRAVCWVEWLPFEFWDRCYCANGIIIAVTQLCLPTFARKSQFGGSLLVVVVGGVFCLFLFFIYLTPYKVTNSSNFFIWLRTWQPATWTHFLVSFHPSIVMCK